MTPFCPKCGRPIPVDDVNLSTGLARCRACNNRKGDRRLEDVGMRLLKRPQAYNLHVNRQIIRYIGRADESWRKYLFY